MGNDASSTANYSSESGRTRFESRKKIRVAYDISNVHTDGAIIGGCHWHLDSPENRRMLQLILESGNEIFGEGAYWIEESEA